MVLVDVEERGNVGETWDAAEGALPNTCTRRLICAGAPNCRGSVPWGAVRPHLGPWPRANEMPRLTLSAALLVRGRVFPRPGR